MWYGQLFIIIPSQFKMTSIYDLQKKSKKLESDTSREGVGGTLFQKQGDEWVIIGYHSKRLPTSAKNSE